MSHDEEAALLASDLRSVIGQLVRRLRTQHRFPLSQGTVLGRLDRQGSMGVSDLAAAERVRPQSMAQTVTDLESAGMVTRRPDPGDGRRALVELTAHGLATLEADRRDREGWLARAIAEDLEPQDRATLARSVELLRRIADG
ncbi:MAG TPA: MarR family transcriptional regulator [Solirubrobacteraceae bacterium]|jgi:DNA-binding MarR family transcriptional regulator|nr:MarR family transcriptional regulator [Solirubrobacteraceae bacterium]